MILNEYLYTSVVVYIHSQFQHKSQNPIHGWYVSNGWIMERMAEPYVVETQLVPVKFFISHDWTYLLIIDEW